MQSKTSASSVRAAQRKLSGLLKEFVEDETVAACLLDHTEDQSLSLFTDPHILNSMGDDVKQFYDAFNQGVKTLAKGKRKRHIFEVGSQISLRIQSSFPSLFEDTSCTNLETKSPSNLEFSVKQKSEFRDIVSKLSKSSYAEPFLHPVDKAAYPEYYEIIEKPMDFTTLRKSINEYKSLVNAINSLRLIWKNCLQFNEENSEISITAKALEKEGELLIEDTFGSTFSKMRGDNSLGQKDNYASVSSFSAKLDRKKSKRNAPVVKLTVAAMKDILKAMQLNEYADPFMNPVTEDIAPGYFEIVSNPMDISTIKRKLRGGSYEDNSEEFISDFNLIWNNCVLYNEPTADIVLWAKSLSDHFESLLLEHHTDEPVQMKKKVMKEIEKNELLESKILEKPEKASKVEEKKVIISSECDISLLDSKLCAELVQKMKGHAFIEPFLNPVDPKIAPGYFDVVANPMDISQVEKSLKKGLYDHNGALFIANMRLIWQNCMNYNDPESEIYDWAVHCGQFFEKELQCLLAYKKDQQEMEAIRNKVGIDIVSKKNGSTGTEGKLGIKGKSLESTDDKKDRVLKRPVEETDTSRKRMVESKQESDKKTGVVDALLPVSSMLDSSTTRESPVANISQIMDKVNKRIKELQIKVDSIKSNRLSKTHAIVQEQCHKKAAEKFKDLKNGMVVCPGILQVEKFGEIDSILSMQRSDLICPINYSAWRSLRIRLLPNDASAQRSIDQSEIVPFVPINLKSSVVLSEDKTSALFRITMDNGVIISEASDPLSAWRNVLGKECVTFQCIGSKLRRCRSVFNRVCASPDSVPFLEQLPIDTPDGSSYYKVIQSPMWLREIHKRLVDGVYDNEYDFAWDMRLIIRNCKSYNLPKSALFGAADRLSSLFEALFLCWVINIQDKSVTDLAKGDWDDWGYLKYFDSNPDQNFCTLTKAKAKANELLQCAWCEDQYLPSALKLPNSKLGLKTWGCPRCRRAMDMAEGDMAGNPFVNLLNDLPYNCAESGGNFYVAVPELGVGWNQARRKNRNSGLKNLYLSPLGYEVYSLDDIQLQKDFEAGIDGDLMNARAKEFKELCADLHALNKRVHRGKNRKDRRRSRSAPDEDDTDNTHTSPIDSKFLEEEGRIVTGKLVDFKVPQGYHLSWCINPSENIIIEEHKAAKDIQSMLTWNHELQSTDLFQYGFFGFDQLEIRSRIEALPNAATASAYCFLQADVVINELLSDYQNQLEEYQSIAWKQEQFHNLVLEERWKFEKSKVFPKHEAGLELPDSEASLADEEFSLKCSQLGFKMVVSKLFPTGGLDILLTLWDLLDSIKSVVGYNYFTLVDLISSVNPPPTLLTTPSQTIFDEVCCILTEQLLLECRNRLGYESEIEWQNILMIHPLNILTWPKILEKCLILMGLPLSINEARRIMECSIQGEYAVHLKVLCLVYNHPYAECIFNFSNESQSSLEALLHATVDRLVGVDTSKVENSAFCAKLLSVVDTIPDLPQQIGALRSWMNALFGRIGFHCEEAMEEESLVGSFISANTARSWGGLILRGIGVENSQYLIPDKFCVDRCSANPRKMKSLASLERALSLLSGTDSEGLCSQDRLSLYLLLVENILVCKAVADLLEKRETMFMERFKVLPVIDNNIDFPEYPLSPAQNVPKSSKCYFTGIPFELFPDASSWVIVPKALIDYSNDECGNRNLVPEATSSDLHQHRRSRRGELHLEDNNQIFGLKFAVLQLLTCQKIALEEQESYETKFEAVAPFFGSNATVDIDVSRSIFSRSHPIGYDRHGNSFWLLAVQQNNCIFEHDGRGKCMDPLDQNTREPCLLLRDKSGQWYYNTGNELNRVIHSLSPAIQSEKLLKYRLIEKYLSFRSMLFSSTLNVKAGQQVWIERKHAMERWIVESPLFAGPNDSHRCRQLEVTLARSCESRMNVYYAHYFRDEDELDRSQRAEREAALRKQKKIRDLMTEESFDMHLTKGWHHRDSSIRIRQLAACSNATKIHGDPAIAGILTSIISKSPFLSKYPSDTEGPGIVKQDQIQADMSCPNSTVIPMECNDVEVIGEEPKAEASLGNDNLDIAVMEQDILLESPDQLQIDKVAQSELEANHRKSTVTKAIEQLHVVTGEVLRIYPSGREAAAFMNISQSGISLCTNGQKTDANGFRWRSYDGPPIDFESIKHLQTPLDDLKLLQVIRGKPCDEDKMHDTNGKTALFYEAIRASHMRNGGSSPFSISFKPPTPLPITQSTLVPQIAQISRIPTVAVAPVPVVPTAQSSSMRPADAQNYTFPSPPAFPKPQNHIVTSSKTASAKLIKLKGELFSILFAFPEKALKWPELDPVKENMVKEAGEAAVKGIYDANKDSGISEVELEKIADKASRKARRRLRRKLAVDQFSVSVQQAVTPQELLNQVLVLEFAVPKFLQFSHNKRSLPVYAYTSSDVALRLFVLDRIIAYNEIVGLENAALFSPYKLRSQFAPRCCASAACSRILGHPGKCTQGPPVMSRLPDHFQLAPSTDPFSKNPVVSATSAHNGLPATLPAIHRPPLAVTVGSRPPPPPPRSYEELLPSLTSIAEKPNVDIEFISPFFPNNLELVDSQWV